MTTHNFTIREVFTFAWAKTVEHGWFLACAFLAAGIIMNAVNNTLLFGVLVGIFTGVAMITVALEIISGKTPTFADLFSNFKTYKVVWHYILASLLYLGIVILGLILFVLPGIYLAIRLQFYKFLVIEHQDMKTTDLLRKSLQISDGYFWKLFAFLILAVAINIIGALFFMVGLLVTIPLTLLANTYIYRKLTHQAHTGN